MLREFIAVGIKFGDRKNTVNFNKTLIEKLENYLVSQLEQKDFIHKRVFATGENTSFKSDYYTGEALFPLMLSERRFPEVQASLESLMFKDYGIPQQSHWMAYAACSALAKRYCDEIRICIYIERLIRSILSDTSYRERHESTPIACRSEALAEFLLTCRRVSYARAYFSAEFQHAARNALAENLARQLEFYGAGQFRKGRESDKVQIDYIQHNGAAFLGWWELLAAPSSPGER